MPVKPVLNAMGVEIDSEDRHVSLKETSIQVGCSRTTLTSMVNNGQFPPKHFMTPGRKAFWQSEINEWKKCGAFEWYRRYGQRYLEQQEHARESA